MKRTIIGLALIAGVISGCSSDGDGLPDVAQANSDNSIAGLWELGTSANGEAKAYLEFTDDNANSYFYAGGNLDQSANCYELETETLTKVDSTTYLLRDSDVETTITATDELLTISFIDAEDDDDDGDTSETIVNQFPRVVNVDVVDLTLCPNAG